MLRFVKFLVLSSVLIWNFTTNPGIAKYLEPDDKEAPYKKYRSDYNSANAALTVDIDVNLRWTASVADSYNVYLGTNFNKVKIASNPNRLPGRGNQKATSYAPRDLEVGTTYYWRIDEVKRFSHGGTVAKQGPVWSFTIHDYVVLDDFESYTGTSTGGNPLRDTYITADIQCPGACRYTGGGTVTFEISKIE